jgi:hypothetical protein
MLKMPKRLKVWGSWYQRQINGASAWEKYEQRW